MMLLPEFLVMGTAFLILIADLLTKKGQSKQWTTVFCLVGLLATAVAILLLMDQPMEILGGRLGIEPLGMTLKGILVGSTFLLVLISGPAFMPNAHQKLSDTPEFFAILLFILSGMMFLVSSRDLVTLYVSLELATIPLFALTAWSKSATSGEAGIKYLIIGSLGSAFLLFGFGFLYAIAGSTSLDLIVKGLSTAPSDLLPLKLYAAALLSVGVSFKLTLFPFHMWAPDAYQGAPTPITAFLSVASKTTGLILAIQLFIKVFGAFLPQWSLGVAVIAALTMTLGNLVAIRQTNLKRFMAFSSISQAGYLIMGFLSATPEALSAMVFYILIYAFTNLAAFGVLIVFIYQKGDEQITGLRGLSKTNPILALVFMVALFGLAGIPPLAGFVGRFFLFNIAAQSGYYWLVAVAALNSTVSLYYYLRLVRQMYIEEPEVGAMPLSVSPLTTVGLCVGSLGSLLIGLVPQVYQSILTASGQWLR